MNDPTNTIVQTASQPRQQELILQEFRLSASPDRLTLANVEFIEGDEAVEILAEHAIAQCQKSASFVGVGAQRLLERYAFVSSGAWAVWGTTLEGGRGTVPIVKPREPRIDFERQRPIKYETPAKAEALPILPFVDQETADLIYQRYKATPLTGETFWQVVRRCHLPIALTEGLKKALALLAHGLPAIAIRGITQWHKKGRNELYQVIADFATAKRHVYIVFDQDEKPSTKRDVRKQALKLGSGLEIQGCKISFLIWDSKLGKGIDDCLFAQSDDAQAWFDNLIATAPTLAAFRRDKRITRALELTERLNRLSYPVERATTGEYLPELPELEQGAIHVVTANMNAGKTYRSGQDWVSWAIAQGWNVLVLSPLNSLGHQTARDWGLPHVHSYGTTLDQQEALWRDVSASHGLVMCANSLHRVPAWFYSRPVLLVLDEANQLISDLAEGNTLTSQYRYQMIWERFTRSAKHASATGAIVLSEDGIPDRAVNLVKALSEAATVRVFAHQKQGLPWSCTVYRGQASGFRASLLQAVSEDKRLLVVTTAQQEGQRLERAITKDHSFQGKKVFRIDSETNEGGQFTSFFEHPDRWLKAHQPDVLILSPSAKSGLSIQGGIAPENAYFSEVWGYFSTLTTDIHMQMLGRFRPSVPRRVFCPDFALSNGDESLLNPRAIKRRLHSNTKALAGVYGLEELLEATDERAALMVTIETAVLDYLAPALAVAGAQKSLLHLALIQRLEQAGHQVTSVTASKDAVTAQLWKEVQEELWRERANEIAAAAVKAEHTPEWARKVLDSLECSLEARILARKVLWRDEFPGIQFDDPEDCYRGLCQGYGTMQRGVRAQAKAENLEGTKEADRAATESILKGDIRALHRLPKHYAQAMLRAKSGVLDLLDGTPYSNTDSRAIAVKVFALRFAREMNYFLRLQIKADQTPVQICHKLLAQFGLERDSKNKPGAILALSRPGGRGEQRDRVYALQRDFDPLRMRLLEAARRKLSESVSTARIERDLSIRAVDTQQPPLPSEGLVAAGAEVRVGARVQWGNRLGDWIVEGLDGTMARVRSATGWAEAMVWSTSVDALRVAS